MTALKSLEGLKLGDVEATARVKKVVYTDSQAALSVCRCAAGSWRTRHLRIRGNLLRELLDQNSWQSFHLEGTAMLADLGTKSLASDRYHFLMHKMGLERPAVETSKAKLVSSSGRVPPEMIALLMLLALVPEVEAMDNGTVDGPDYVFLVMMVMAVIGVWEVVRQTVTAVWRRGRTRPREQVAEQPVVADGSSEESSRESDSEPGSPPAREDPVIRLRTAVPKAKSATVRPPPPVLQWGGLQARELLEPPSRDSWTTDLQRKVLVRWHGRRRFQLFVPEHARGGLPSDQLTGRRRTIARFVDGSIRIHEDDYRSTANSIRDLGQTSWVGRTELEIR